jgi:SAM-dependent methyltransferase
MSELPDDEYWRCAIALNTHWGWKLIDKLKQLYRTLAVARDVAKLGNLPRAWDLDRFLAPHDSVSRQLVESSSLDIGCGTNPRNPFRAQHVFGIDIRADAERNVRNITYADLTTDPIPFPDRFFDYITAGDFIEHLPRVIYAPARRFPFVELMNEIWRALKPGGLFLSRTPVYPFSAAFRDPTHVNIISHETFPLYFDDKHRLAAMYGFAGSFRILWQAVRPPHLISLLERVDR